MIGRAEGLPTPFPLGDTLPAIYRESDFPDLPQDGDTPDAAYGVGPESERPAPSYLDLCAACDEVLAPIFSTLDNFAAYLDPGTAPPQMLDALARWIGLTIAASADTRTIRRRIAATTEHLGRQGTQAAIKAKVAAAFGLGPDDTDATLSPLAVPGSAGEDGRSQVPPPLWLMVRVTTDDRDAIDRQYLKEFVDKIKPAHLPHRVEVVDRRRGWS